MLEWTKNFDPHDEAVRWLAQFDNIEQAWYECERGDLLLQLVERLNIDHRRLMLAEVECARLAQHLMLDQRSLDLLYVAEQYGNGKVTKEDLDKIAARAGHAAIDAHNGAITVLDEAHMMAAHAAYAAAICDANVADYVASALAIYAARNDIDFYFDASVKKEILKQCAEIVRRHFSFEEVSNLLSSRTSVGLSED